MISFPGGRRTSPLKVVRILLLASIIIYIVSFIALRTWPGLAMLTALFGIAGMIVAAFLCATLQLLQFVRRRRP